MRRSTPAAAPRESAGPIKVLRFKATKSLMDKYPLLFLPKPNNPSVSLSHPVTSRSHCFFPPPTTATTTTPLPSEVPPSPSVGAVPELARTISRRLAVSSRRDHGDIMRRTLIRRGLASRGFSGTKGQAFVRGVHILQQKRPGNGQGKEMFATQDVDAATGRPGPVVEDYLELFRKRTNAASESRLENVSPVWISRLKRGTTRNDSIGNYVPYTVAKTFDESAARLTERQRRTKTLREFELELLTVRSTLRLPAPVVLSTKGKESMCRIPYSREQQRLYFPGSQRMTSYASVVGFT